MRYITCFIVVLVIFFITSINTNATSSDNIDNDIINIMRESYKADKIKDNNKEKTLEIKNYDENEYIEKHNDKRKVNKAKDKPTENIKPPLKEKNKNGDSLDNPVVDVLLHKKFDLTLGKDLFYQGLLYHTGVGVEKDYCKAVRFYRKAAETGDPRGYKNIGDMFMKGECYAKDEDTAIYWYRQASKRGIPIDEHIFIEYEAKKKAKKYNENCITFIALSLITLLCFAYNPKKNTRN